MAELHDVAEIMLHPGEHAVRQHQHRIRTLLGSCVAITLWHRARRIGAMCHYMLPTRGKSGKSPVGMPDGRYGEEALGLMLQGLAALKVAPLECEAKLFGGGVQLHAPRYLDVGRLNGEAGRDMLQQLGIPVVAESLFGFGYRRICFDVCSGEVLQWKGGDVDIGQMPGESAWR
jgi:chemotaxis protein CheD